MTLLGIIAALDASGTSPAARDILDVLWLASQEVRLSLRKPGRPKPRLPPLAGEKEELAQPDATKDEKVEFPPPADDSPVYPSISHAAEGSMAKAAPVAVPASQGLRNKLALMRALRPFRQPWLSTRELEIDEIRTAEATAESGYHSSFMVRPAFKPERQRWYDVNVVTEDDPLIDVWGDVVAQFCVVLRDTGAFGRVQPWRLRLAPSEYIEEEDGQAPPRLESPTGRRILSRDLVSTGRRTLILFVTHGSSAFWRDTSYAHVLSHWHRDASVAIVQLLPRERWPYTYLGDHQGLCFTEEPGATSARLKAEPFWWLVPETDISAFLKIPLVSLRPEEIGDWASMQMGRGRRSPVLLLDPKDRSCQVPSADPASRRDFERAIAQLREVSPQAFRLATYLAPSNFTIPVARLIQEAKFGAATDPSHLGELFLSGLVFARAQSEDSPIVNRYFGFWPEAREILVRSLRQEDARWVVSELERQVSKYIEKVAGRSITFKGLVRRADGTYDLPEWATPFAQVANSLLGLSRADGELARAVDAFLHSAPLRSSRRDVLAILANLAEGGAFDESQIDRDILKELIGAHLIEHQGEQSWRFVEGVQGLLSKALLERSASGAVVRSGAPLMSQDGRVLGVRTGPSNLVRIYRHGFGECEFLSLDVPGGPPYNILVNCGLISGTPNAGAILTEVVDDVVRRSAGKLDILIVTQALRTKLSGFDVAEGWDRLEVDQLLLGWWEDPSDNLARELKYQDPAGTSRAAISSVKRKAKRSRFLNPTDEPYPLGETGARLFVLGVQRDLQYVQRFSWGPDQALDFAIELATGDVLLFVACNNSKIWRIWSEMSWIARDREVAGTDLLSRVVFCRTRLLGDDAQNLIQRAIPLMPSLRFVSAPSDRPLIAKRRWTLSAVGELTALLHSRGGAVLLSDVDPGYLPSDLLASHLYFDISLASRGGQSMRADRGRTRTKKKVSSKTIRRKK